MRLSLRTCLSVCIDSAHSSIHCLLLSLSLFSLAHSQNHVQIVLHESGEPLFYNQRDGPFMPTLKLLHKSTSAHAHTLFLYSSTHPHSVVSTASCALVPHIMKHVRADKGAIPFVLSGANVMCPGLTSAGGDMPEDLPAGTPVAIMAEGKEHAMAIGILTLSTDDMYVATVYHTCRCTR